MRKFLAFFAVFILLASSAAWALGTTKLPLRLRVLEPLLGTFGNVTATELSIIDGATITTTDLNSIGAAVTGATFAISSEFSNSITTSIQFFDAGGTAIASTVCAEVFFSTTDPPTSNSDPATEPTAGTDGFILDGATGNYKFCSEADGDLDVDVGFSGDVSRYLNVILPNGVVSTSGVLDFN